MVDSNPLSSLQLAILHGMGAIEGVFLTGGSCLSHAYLRHRRSVDLDFFTVREEQVTEVVARLRHVAAGHGWTLEETRTWPGFRRFTVTSVDDATMVDIAHDAAPQLVAVENKPVVDGVRWDDLRDILANKLCAVLGRSEVKDLVDLFALDRHGHDALAALSDAQAKDGGMEPATLAWVLRNAQTDPSRLLLIEPITEAELRAFRDRLVERLAEGAWPSNP